VENNGIRQKKHGPLKIVLTGLNKTLLTNGEMLVLKSLVVAVELPLKTFSVFVNFFSMIVPLIAPVVDDDNLI